MLEILEDSQHIPNHITGKTMYGSSLFSMVSATPLHDLHSGPMVRFYLTAIFSHDISYVYETEDKKNISRP